MRPLLNIATKLTSNKATRLKNKTNSNHTTVDTDTQIRNASCLDSKLFPRTSRYRNTTILLTNSKQVPSQLRIIVVLTASYWEFHNLSKPYEERIRTIRATSRQVAYDNRFNRKFCTRTLVRWDTAL